MTDPSKMQPTVEDDTSPPRPELPAPQPSDQQESKPAMGAGDDTTTPNPTSSPSPSASPPTTADTNPPIVPSGPQPHPQTKEILRQVEYYFSDENLPHDAHLLSKTGNSGQEWVSINEILSWRKMRAFKPPAQVKASLAQSERLEVWKNKFIRRKEPLRAIITAKPRGDPKKEMNKQLVEKPWLTKGILKPTGFEKDFVEAPLSPEEFKDQATKLYDADESFTIRIENAVAMYTTKRKFHQLSLQIFTKFLMFGGFSCGPHMFTGGMTDKEMKEEELDSIDIAQRKSQFAVSDAVIDGFDPDLGTGSWEVDFEGMAKAFLSSHFMVHFEWKEAKPAEAATNILRNFYNYLLYHNVCPEYQDQIMRARQVCETAEAEFAVLAEANKHLPGQFNIACSTLCGGHFAQIRPSPGADWVLEEDRIGLSDEDATQIFHAGILAHGDKDVFEKMRKVAKQELEPDVVSEEEIGLEVVSIDKCADQAKEVYKSKNAQADFIKPAGKLHCIRWELPHRPPKDLPKHVVAERKAKVGQKIDFIVDDETLQYCYPGLKLEVVVKELNMGIKWIDLVNYVYPSFFAWTLNEPYRDYKEPGPPKAWMLRQMEKESGDGEQGSERVDEAVAI